MAKMEMMADRQKQMLLQLVDELRDKSSVFVYNNNPEAEIFVKLLSEDIKNIEGMPVIKIFWNENEKLTSRETEDNYGFYLFKNFTSTMIKIVKLLSEKKHLVLVADMSTLENEENAKPYIHFISTLLRKSAQYDCTLLTLVNEKMIEARFKDELIPFFDQAFLLGEKRITKLPDRKPYLEYAIRGSVIEIEPHLQADMNKIREIFSLTPEEKEELDKLVGQSLEEYRTSM